MAKTIIYQNQTGLLIRDGSIVHTLGAGVYHTHGLRNETIVTYPTHRQSYAIALSTRTAESALVTVAVTIGVTIENAERLHLSGKTAYEIVNQSVTRLLQDAAASKTLSELLVTDLVIDEKTLNGEIAAYGLNAVIELAPKVHLPRNLQNAVDAQEVARQRGKAELEEARGRTAVIRHYANAANLTKENPDLLRLLLGQKAKSINVAFDAAGKAAK